MHTNPSDFEAQAELVVVEAALEELELIAARQAQESMQAAWISDGDRCSKRFFSILKSRSAVNSIQALADLTGRITDDPDEILSLATQYYDYHLNDNHLRNCDTVAEDRQYILSFLSDRLEAAHLAKLDQPITEKEVLEAVKGSPKGLYTRP